MCCCQSTITLLIFLLFYLCDIVLKRSFNLLIFYTFASLDYSRRHHVLDLSVHPSVCPSVRSFVRSFVDRLGFLVLQLFTYLRVWPRKVKGQGQDTKIAKTSKSFIVWVKTKMCKIRGRYAYCASHCRFSCFDFNPLDSKGNYSATSNNTNLVHWPLMGGSLHLVQRGGAWAGCGPAQSSPRCTKCNSPPINGQCTNHCIAIWWSVALRF